MQLPFSLFLALKYLRPKRTFLSIVTVISVLGVLLGVAVLVIVLSVMTGFDEMWRTKILDFNAHITVSVSGGLADEESPTYRSYVTAGTPFHRGDTSGTDFVTDDVPRALACRIFEGVRGSFGPGWGHDDPRCLAGFLRNRGA